GRVPYDERHDRAAGVVHRFRFVNDVPLNAAHTGVRGHCIASWERGADTVQHCRWVTDLRVSTRNVYHLLRGGDEPGGRSQTRPATRCKTRATTLSTPTGMASSIFLWCVPYCC